MRQQWQLTHWRTLTHWRGLRLAYEDFTSTAQYAEYIGLVYARAARFIRKRSLRDATQTSVGAHTKITTFTRQSNRQVGIRIHTAYSYTNLNHGDITVHTQSTLKSRSRVLAAAAHAR